MKVTAMSAEAAATGLLWKLCASLGAGVLGGAIMASIDPPASRKELFKQASAAGVGSLVFGPLAVRFLNHYFPFLDGATSIFDVLEIAVPMYFLVGALSWGFFGAVAKARKLIADKATSTLAKKFGVDE